jgi:cysteine desulfurase
MKKPVYLDYNGTTPLDQEVIEAMMPYMTSEFGNPSSNHWYGIAPKRALINARRQVAALINCDVDEIVFTSGGTESNNHAIKGIAGRIRPKGGHIVTSSIEHPAVIEVCRSLAKNGIQTTFLPVDTYGLVSPDQVENAIRTETVLVTVMHSNNEVGTIEPISKISGIAHKHRVAMHTDAAQSIGKVPVDVQELCIDLLSIAGHKLYAPKGVGALYIKSGVELEGFMHGAGQENKRRAGTENIIEIVGLGKACEIAARDLKGVANRMIQLRNLLHENINRALGDTVRLNGHPVSRLPNTLSLSFKNLEANRILEEIGLDVAASPGAACHSDTVKLSHVLEAMAIPTEWANGTLRFTVGRMTTREEIDRASQSVIAAVSRLRGL